MFQHLYSSIIFPIKDFFFPPLCFSCKNRLRDNEQRICLECWNSIAPTKSHDATVQLLYNRFEEDGNVTKVFSYFYFEKRGVFQQMIHSLKYEGTTKFGFEFGVYVGKQLQEEKEFPVCNGIIPIPLNPMKERERGYNQSEVIAKGISSVLNIPVCSKIVQRVKYTTTQTYLNPLERKENVKDAFVLNSTMKNFVKGKKFLIVDDVITTGATIQAVAKIIKENGSGNIYVASAALAKLEEDKS